jgi:hypothetical protein
MAESRSPEDLNRLIQELGATIRRTLAESPQIARCFSQIREEGYDVSLQLEATMGFHRRGSGGEATGIDVRVEKGEPRSLKMTPLDKKFLRSLKISVEEE